MKSRISVFVDGASFFFMQKRLLRWFADPRKFLEYIRNTYGNIVDAFYYFGQEVNPEPKQKAFLDALPYMGYSLVTKHVKTQFDDETGDMKRKANLDIEIVIDMFNTIDNYDCAILVSGNGDFERVLQVLKARGKKYHVFATEKLLAKELRVTAGMHYTDLDDIKKHIEKN